MDDGQDGLLQKHVEPRARPKPTQESTRSHDLPCYTMTLCHDHAYARSLTAVSLGDKTVREWPASIGLFLNPSNPTSPVTNDQPSTSNARKLQSIARLIGHNLKLQSELEGP